jgi:hypothetical protein
MEGNLLLLSPLTPLEHRYPSTLLCFLHPLSSLSYDSFGSDLLTILLPPRSYFPQPPPIRWDRRLATRSCNFNLRQVFNLILDQNFSRILRSKGKNNKTRRRAFKFA